MDLKKIFHSKNLPFKKRFPARTAEASTTTTTAQTNSSPPINVAPLSAASSTCKPTPSVSRQPSNTSLDIPVPPSTPANAEPATQIASLNPDASSNLVITGGFGKHREVDSASTTRKEVESSQPLVQNPPSSPSSFPVFQSTSASHGYAHSRSNDETWVQLVAPIALPLNSGGPFNHAHHFTVNNPTFYDMSPNLPDTFMKDFAERTIRGAAVDSSVRDPPPRCHPGTRLSTIEETRGLCTASPPPKRLAWIVGPAGVGKSAIMQTVAETLPNLGAALFFSANGCNDSTKAIATLAYQLATKFYRYYDYVRTRLTQDPTIFDKAMSVQFNEFFTEPFANRLIYRGTESLVMFIDGVDECDSVLAQRELLELISHFIVRHPSIPLLWITASRPEPHITGFFDTLDTSLFSKTELSADSDKSCADVEKYLRDSFSAIRSKYPSLQFHSQWPTEHQLIRIIATARGLFAYGSTAVRFVDDVENGDPQSQLELLLEVIDNFPSKGNDNDSDMDPMAQLYGLYDRIISRIPKRTLPRTLRLLYFSGVLGKIPGSGYSLPWVAEWLCMTPDIVYASFHHLHSVLRIPSTLDLATHGVVHVHHKSFHDYLEKKFPAVTEEFKSITLDIAVAILKDVFASREKICDEHLRPWDGLTTHWPWPQSDMTQVKSLLYSQVSHTIQSSEETCRRIVLHDANIIHALRVMSTNCFNGASSAPVALFLPNWLLDKVAVCILKETKIVRDVQVGTLDLDRIWHSQQNFYILYRKRDLKQASPRTLARIQCSHKWGPSTKSGDYYITMRTIGASTRESKTHHGCRKQLEGDLMNVYSKTPDTLVTTWTGGDGLGLVIYDFVDPDNAEIEWKYIMPYEASILPLEELTDSNSS
ncbi:hypothetical protein AN958_06126 [Leucoagaricus sp. SymC.cos]|nr:hypothetical protein AN958_06126 [Leucoagaricus sp. SymC.cos]